LVKISFWGEVLTFWGVNYQCQDFHGAYFGHPSLIDCILVVTVLLFLLYFFFDIVVAFIILKLQPIKMLLFELFLLIVSCSHRSGWGI